MDLQSADEALALLAEHLALVTYSRNVENPRAIVAVDEVVATITGFEADSYTRDPELWLSRVHPIDQVHVLQALDTLLSEGTCTWAYRWQTAAGTYQWCRDVARRVPSADGVAARIEGAWQLLGEEAAKDAHGSDVGATASAAN